MFGHDDHNNDEEKGHITLPPTDNFGQDDNGSNDVNSTAPQGVPTPPDTELGDLVKTDHRGGSTKSGAPTDELLDIKQEALQALTPLVNHLEQSPEEKFRTTMMMIQASDNHGLIKVAYDAAKEIPNEKERAQALLDIVNEINYFTQSNPQS